MLGDVKFDQINEWKHWLRSDLFHEGLVRLVNSSNADDAIALSEYHYLEGPIAYIVQTKILICIHSTAREVEDFIMNLPDCSRSNEMQVYLYFKMNAPKNLPDHVKFLLETAFNLEERNISCNEISNNKDVEMMSKLYDLLRDHVLSKPFECEDWDGRIQTVCRVFLLALIEVVGYSYSEL